MQTSGQRILTKGYFAGELGGSFTEGGTVSVQPFLRGSQMWPTDEHRPRYRIHSNRCAHAYRVQLHLVLYLTISIKLGLTPAKS